LKTAQGQVFVFYILSVFKKVFANTIKYTYEIKQSNTHMKLQTKQIKAFLT